jgi:hypothetical protein
VKKILMNVAMAGPLFEEKIVAFLRCRVCRKETMVPLTENIRVQDDGQPTHNTVQLEHEPGCRAGDVLSRIRAAFVEDIETGRTNEKRHAPLIQEYNAMVLEFAHVGEPPTAEEVKP